MSKEKIKDYVTENGKNIELNENNKKDLMRRVKELRERMGMTQQEFSDYFEVSTRAVEEWERGGRRIPMYLLKLMEYKAENEKINK